MALRKDIIYKGIDIVDAYIRVAHIDGNKHKIYFNLQYYTSKQKSDEDIINNNNENVLFTSNMYSIVPDLSSQYDILAQMYLYLKTLDEFENAYDVIDPLAPENELPIPSGAPGGE